MTVHGRDLEQKHNHKPRTVSIYNNNWCVTVCKNESFKL